MREIVYVITCIIGFFLFALFANRERFYFFPVKSNRYDPNEHWIDDKIHGLYYKKEKNNSTDTIVLIYHGNAGNVYNRVNLLNLINMNLGCDVYVYDYPGFNKTPGSATQKTLYESGIYVFDYWRKNGNYKRVILYGESIGCAIASYVGSERNADGIILQAGPSSIKDMIYHMGIPFIGNFIYDFDTYENLEKIVMNNSKNQKITVMHSEDDEIVPYTQGKKLASLSEDINFMKIRGDHNNPIIPWTKILSIYGFR